MQKKTHFLLNTRMIYYTCAHSRGLWVVVEGVIMDCCSEKRQEKRQNCILMSQIFQRQAETFLEREEGEQEDAELSPKRFAQSPPDHPLESGLRVRKNH